MDPNNVAVIIFEVILFGSLVVLLGGRLILSGIEYRDLQRARLAAQVQPTKKAKKAKKIAPIRNLFLVPVEPKKPAASSSAPIRIEVSGKAGGSGDGSATARRCWVVE